MDKQDELQLREAASDALSTLCYRNDDGMFYIVCEINNNEELSKSDLQDICNADDPREEYHDKIFDYFVDYASCCANALLNAVLEDSEVAELIEQKQLDPDEVDEIIRDLFYVEFPSFYKQEILVNIVLDTGDMNYDFVSNSIGGHHNASDDSIPEESGLLWLARQQGYKKSELKKALANHKNVQSPLLESIYYETVNCSTAMNALVFLIKMTLEEYFTLRDGIDKERERNKSYRLSDRTGRGYLILSKDTTCGLFDSWNGSGSMMEIKLEKDVRVPFRCIYSARYDGCQRYGIQEVYGCGSELWTENAVKKIHAMKQ